MHRGLADPALLTRLDVKVGDRITLAGHPVTIRGTLTSEPDKIAGGIGFGPRLMISEPALRATGLVQPGSLNRWSYRIVLPKDAARDSDIDAAQARIRAATPEAGGRSGRAPTPIPASPRASSASPSS